MSEPTAPLVRDQRAALLGRLAGLDAVAWETTTRCRGWPVRHVVAHLVEGELLWGRVYRGELTEVGPDDLDAEAGVERWRRTDGETVRYSLWHHGEAAQRVIDSRSDESWRREVGLAGQTVRLVDVLHLHFFDLALHSLDVCDALGVGPAWDDRTREVVEHCLRGAPSALADAGVAPGPALRVRVPEAGEWLLAGRNGAWTLMEGPAEAAGLSWEVPAEVLVLATTGRLEASEALAASRVEGEAEALRTVLRGWRLKG